MISSTVEKFIVLGFIKSGQEAMVTYLQKRYGIFTRKDECVWRTDGIDIYKRKYLERGIRPVFITRDPVKRIWSHYHYFGFHKAMEFNEFINHRGYDNTIFGEESPISQSNYTKWIKPFLPYNPIVVSLEDMRMNPNFAQINMTKDVQKDYKESIPDTFKELIEEKMLEEIRDHKEISWSVNY